MSSFLGDSVHHPHTVLKLLKHKLMWKCFVSLSSKIHKMSLRAWNFLHWAAEVNLNVCEAQDARL